MSNDVTPRTQSDADPSRQPKSVVKADAKDGVTAADPDGKTVRHGARPLTAALGVLAIGVVLVGCWSGVF